jgi:hypothetical protein
MCIGKTYAVHMVHTISSIKSETGASDRTVRTWLEKAKAKEDREIGEIVNGARVFSDSERDLLLSFAKPKSPNHPEIIQAEIVEGNHRAVVDGPIVPVHYNLAALRSDSAATVQISNPGEVATQAIAAMDQLIAAMQQDNQVQRDRVEESTAALAMVAAKAQELRDERLKYMVRSEITADRQNQLTAAIQAEVGKLQAIAAPDGG